MESVETNVCNRRNVSDLTLEQLQAAYNEFAESMKGQIAYLKVSEKTYIDLDRCWREKQQELVEKQGNPTLLLFNGLPARISNFVPDDMAVGFDLDGNVVRIFSLQETNG